MYAPIKVSNSGPNEARLLGGVGGNGRGRWRLGLRVSAARTAGVRLHERAHPGVAAEAVEAETGGDEKYHGSDAPDDVPVFIQLAHAFIVARPGLRFKVATSLRICALSAPNEENRRSERIFETKLRLKVRP